MMTTFLRSSASVFFLCLLAACSGETEAPEAVHPIAEPADVVVEAPADAVFINGNVYTVNGDQPGRSGTNLVQRPADLAAELNKADSGHPLGAF